MTGFLPINQHNNQLYKPNSGWTQPVKYPYPSLSIPGWTQLKRLAEEETDIWRNPNDYRQINSTDNAKSSDNDSLNYLA